MRGTVAHQVRRCLREAMRQDGDAWRNTAVQRVVQWMLNTDSSVLGQLPRIVEEVAGGLGRAPSSVLTMMLVVARWRLRDATIAMSIRATDAFEVAGLLDKRDGRSCQEPFDLSQGPCRGERVARATVDRILRDVLPAARVCWALEAVAGGSRLMRREIVDQAEAALRILGASRRQMHRKDGGTLA